MRLHLGIHGLTFTKGAAIRDRCFVAALRGM